MTAITRKCIFVPIAQKTEEYCDSLAYQTDLSSIIILQFNSQIIHFERMVNQIYPPEMQLNKPNTSDTEYPILDLHLSISSGSYSSKIYDMRDYFDFDIEKFSFLDGDVPRRPSYGVYTT